MKNVRFHDSKLKLVKALRFGSFHKTEAPTAGFCSAFICGRAYSVPDGLMRLWKQKPQASVLIIHWIQKLSPDAVSRGGGGGGGNLPIF